MEIESPGMNRSIESLDAFTSINSVLTEPSLDDTICPVDFEQNGQITSDTVRLD